MRPKFATFAYIFIPFGWLLVGGNLAAEMSENPTLYRVLYSIWITLGFAGPAMVLAALYDLRHAPLAVYNTWRLLWTFAFLAYGIHFYFSYWEFFDGDLDQIYRRQGSLVATTNLVVTGLWTIEMILIWFTHCRSNTKCYIFQSLFHLLVLVAIFASTVLFKSGFVWYLGLVIVSITLLCLLARLVLGDASPEE
jgi:hypothetical protein